MFTKYQSVEVFKGNVNQRNLPGQHVRAMDASGHRQATNHRLNDKSHTQLAQGSHFRMANAKVMQVS